MYQKLIRLTNINKDNWKIEVGDCINSEGLPQTVFEAANLSYMTEQRSFMQGENR